MYKEDKMVQRVKDALDLGRFHAESFGDNDSAIRILEKNDFEVVDVTVAGVEDVYPINNVSFAPVVRETSQDGILMTVHYLLPHYSPNFVQKRTEIVDEISKRKTEENLKKSMEEEERLLDALSKVTETRKAQEAELEKYSNENCRCCP